MARQKSHKDVEFEVEHSGGKGEGGNFHTWQEATVYAVDLAANYGGTVDLNVIVWSRAGAKWWGGDYGAEQYEDDPEASVFERFEVKVNVVGRVP